MHVLAMLLATIAFVPIDDRPVTAQLPVMLGRIAGVSVEAPPRDLQGRFLQAGRSDAIIAWLNHEGAKRATDAFVISTDMLAYGGLTASRVPGPAYADAAFRLRELAHLRARRPGAWIGAFGTIMRLAPTGIPAGTPFFAPYPVWSYLQDYANLHDPPLPSEAARAQHLRELIGEPTFEEYMATRGRNLAVDRLLLELTANGTIDRLVLGQDDAGPVGLHVRDVALLQHDLAAANLIGRVSIEPGADELGSALVANAIARTAKWTPRITVRYSTPGGASYQDPIEYAPISTAIDALVGVCGGVRDDDRAEIVLYVRVPGTTPVQDAQLLGDVRTTIAQGRSAAVADLSYLRSYRDQAGFAQLLLESDVSQRIDAYSSWNTNANTVGTALAEAIAAGAGRRMHTYDELAHRTYTFTMFLDDYAYHDFVRPDLNAALASQGIADHTLLSPDVAAAMSERDRALLWGYALKILVQLDPGYHIAAMQLGLPWSRTFETSIDVGLAPNL
ncbi:MAG: DUF4127 family protein [Candidatus Eremiobacteraeota bacterium]|nr:DUF4127 family protein [Candidatus Eremiobacteraeota bacterium]MBV8499941.1 DUF4127 family protein [Candidatus Eremiobacteraeota bacterium]